jgi:hypothetical protein
MPTRPILVRVALLTGLLVGLVVLADGVVRQQLQHAASDTASMPTEDAVQTTGTIR